MSLESKLEILSFHAIHLNAIKKHAFFVKAIRLIFVQRLDHIKEEDLCQIKLQGLELKMVRRYSTLWGVQLLVNIQLLLRFQLQK